MEFVFNKNQSVDLQYNNDLLKVVAKQKTNTPGIFIEKELEVNKKYLFELVCYKRSRKVVRLWFADIKNNQVYYEPVEINRSVTKIRRILSTENNFVLKFGILFVNPIINDCFFVKNLKINEINMNIKNVDHILFKNINKKVINLKKENYVFNKNQNVDIVYEKKRIKVTSKQKKSTPGSYVIQKIEKNKTYLLDTVYYKQNKSNTVKLWICKGNTTIYTKNDNNQNRVNLRKIIKSGCNTTIKIGLLFVSPKIGDNMYIDRLIFQEFDTINDRRFEEIIIKEDSVKKKIPLNFELKNNYEIVQLLFPIHRKRVYFVRTLLLKQNSDKNILFILPQFCKDFIMKNNIYKNFVDDMIFVKDWIDICSILDAAKPEKIILTTSPHVSIISRLEKYRNLIYYVHHGIIMDENVSKIIKQKWDTKIKYLVGNVLGKELIIKGGVDRNNINLVNGLPQFDYAVHNLINKKKLKDDFINEYNINPNNKIILLINGSANVKYYSNPLVLNRIIGTINNLKFETTIVLKNKYDLKFQLRDENVINLTNQDMIYDYFFADMIIVMDGGTALIESLIGNYEKTIFIDWYERKKDLFMTKKLNLIKAKNNIELKRMISSKINNKNDSNLKKEIDSYKKTVLGYNDIKFVSDDILEIIYNY